MKISIAAAFCAEFDADNVCYAYSEQAYQITEHTEREK